MEIAGSPGRNGLLRCPTPVSVHRTLISHQITRETCLRLQREMYHKCFLCLNSSMQQARFREMLREKTLANGGEAPILGSREWPSFPDAGVPGAAGSLLSPAIPDDLDAAPPPPPIARLSDRG